MKQEKLLTKENTQDIHPLSPMQQGMFFHYLYDTTSTAYFEQLSFHIRGEVNLQRIEQSLHQLSQRHNILRTIFLNKSGKNMLQVVLKKAPIPLTFLDYSQEQNIDAQLETFKQNDRNRPFNLTKEIPMRVTIIKIDQNIHQFTWSYHHILMDGWSLGIVISDFLTIYNNLPLPPAQPYRIYIDWLAKQNKEATKEFWSRYLQNYETPTTLPQLKPDEFQTNQTGETPTHHQLTLTLTETQTESLNRLASQNQVTLNIVLQAAWGVLLSKYNHTRDAVFGSVVSGRPADIRRIETMTGLFINTIPVRIKYHNQTTIRQLLQNLREDHTASQSHHYCSLADIQNLTPTKRDLFDHIIAFENYPLTEKLEAMDQDNPQNGQNEPIEPIKQANRSSHSNLTWKILKAETFERTNYHFNIIARPGKQLEICFRYNSTIYHPDIVAVHARVLETVLNQFSVASHQTGDIPDISDNSVEAITLVDDAERKRLLDDFNNTTVPYPTRETIHQLFRRQAHRQGDSPALLWAGVPGTPDHDHFLTDRQLTYHQLEEYSNYLAAQLIKKGVTPCQVIAVMGTRSLEMVVAILAVLKTGSAYLPIDPDYPPERIDYILRDSNTPLLLQTAQDLPSLKRWNREILLFADIFPQFPHHTVPLPREPHSVGDAGQLSDSGSCPAYVMYTSGSTGQPKGVLVTHRNVVRLVRNTNFVPLTPETRILQTGAPVFDAATFEIWGALLNGGRLVLTQKDLILDAHLFAEVLIRHRVNTLWLSAPLFNRLVQQNIQLFQPLHYLLVGGDILSPAHINRVRERFPHLNIINGYGPTENTTFSTTFLIRHTYTHNIPIGRPINNSTAYILDSQDNLVPIGVPGQLCVSGDGVALGYLNNPERTSRHFPPFPPNQKFCGDPRGGLFKRAPWPPEGRRRQVIYKTGDLARWLPDGTIQFRGRMDRQVKIRGFRIELGEIETQLLKLETIKQAVVLDHQQNGEKYLCAYIVSRASDHTPSFKQTLRDVLSQHLPDYMIPAYFIPVHHIPLTANGKIDKKALTQYRGHLSTTGLQTDSHSNATAPRDQTEKTLARVWMDTLGHSAGTPHIDDNFFQCGGHSLNAALLVAGIHKALNVKIPLKEIFALGTIRNLAEYINQSHRDTFHHIEPIEKRDYYPLSPAQNRMYILAGIDHNTTTYNIPLIFRLQGTIQQKRLEDVFHQLILRHQSLRTSFHMQEETPIQVIHDHVPFKINYYQIQPHEEVSGEMDPQLHRIVQRFVQPFDLSQAPLMRVGLIKISTHSDASETAFLIVDMHHIISDGVSMDIIAREFAALYPTGPSTPVSSLPPLTLQYNDYAAWQQSRHTSESFRQQEAFWLNLYRDLPPQIQWPLDFPRPPVQSFHGSSIPFQVTHENVDSLKKLAEENRTTLYTVLLTLYIAFLSKLTGQEDIIIGTPVAGRSHADLQTIVGMFVNTLALRNPLTQRQSFLQLLAQTKYRTLDAFANQDYPYEELVEKVDIHRDTARNPLFDTMFTLRIPAARFPQIPGLSFAPYPVHIPISKFDLSLRAVDNSDSDSNSGINPGTLDFTFEYCTELFREETIRRFIRFFKAVLTRVIREPNVSIFQLELMDEAEKKHLLETINHTASDFPGHKTIPQLFREQVHLYPHRIALVGKSNNSNNDSDHDPLQDTHHLTYSQLYRLSQQVTRSLKSKGLRSNDIVGMFTDPCLEMIIGILGILTAGAAYLPLDTMFPPKRTRYMTADCCTHFLLTTTPIIQQARAAVDSQVEIIDLNHLICNVDSNVDYNIDYNTDYNTDPDQFGDHSENQNQDTITSTHASFSSHSPAYIIYTSGTTGLPKGVVASHRNAVRVVRDTNYIHITPNDRLLQLSSYAFDGSVFDIYGALLNGAALIILPKQRRMAADLLAETIKKEHITLFFVTTSLFNILTQLEIHCFAHVRNVLVGGEELSVDHTRTALVFMGPGRIINGYGPTETTVFATHYPVDYIPEDARTIPIGRPISNTSVYVLDSYLQPVPFNVPGTLYIGGDGNAAGYLNNPQQTAQRFVVDKQGNRLYNSGDRVRMRPDGNIEFLGRIDQQVKIRGFRIELGDIRHHLLKHPAIKEAYIILRQQEQQQHEPPTEPSDKILCAYFTLNPGHEQFDNNTNSTDSRILRDYLSAFLPEYMIPTYFIPLEQFPLTSNSKIDLRALPNPAIQTPHNIPPRNHIDRELIHIWSQILSIDPQKISIDADFFHLGGHSLKATAMTARINKILNVKIQLAQVFNTPTIRELSDYIDRQSQTQSADPTIPPAEKRHYYPLSPSQETFYILSRMKDVGTAFNLPHARLVKGKEPIDEKRLAHAFQTIIQRHHSLRTSFEIVRDEPVQRIHQTVPFSIESVHPPNPDGEQPQGTTEDAAASLEKNIENAIQSFVRPFDLSQPPLLRVGLADMDNHSQLLMFDTHHIVSDGTSWSVMLREFLAYYQGQTLPPLPIQYTDFAQWQNSPVGLAEMEAQEAWWLEQFRHLPPRPKMFTDYLRPQHQSFQGARIKFLLDPGLSRKLQQLAEENGATLFIVLLCALNILLSSYAGVEDVTIGTPIAGRRHVEVENIIGVFINALALRNYPTSDKSIRQLLLEIKENTLKAYENQAYPIDRLIQKLGISTENGRHPLFDIDLVLLNMEFPAMEVEDLVFEPVAYDYSVTQVDIAFFCNEQHDGLRFDIFYCTRLYKAETIERLIDYFKEILELMADDPGKRLRDISLKSHLKTTATDSYADQDGDFNF